MIDISKIKIGDKVCYQPDHYKSENKYENGIVKEVPDWSKDSIRVVYNCAGDWNNYKDYTSALTNVRDLTLGWKY
jgi:hypothetical protein